MKHRVSIHDLTILAAIVGVLTYVAYATDIFVTQGRVDRAEQTIELDEMLLIGVVLTMGLLIFGIRRYLDQKAEIERRRKAENYARELAFQDPLTSLANRRQFEEALAIACASPPSNGLAHALFILDLNGFKQINDSFGHGTGDEVLIIVAQRLLRAARAGDLVARLGGDEFVVLATHLGGPEAASLMAARILQLIAEPVVIGKIAHHVGSGIGIALMPTDASTTSEALRKADVALYRAKSERRSAVRFFEEDMDAVVREREQMDTALREAVAQSRIQPRYRPTFDLKSGSVVGFQVAPVWITRKGEEIEPERFLPASEENGLIHEIASSVLRTACAAARLWPEHVTLSIDVYPSQIKNPQLAASILEMLTAAKIAFNRLELDVSEEMVVRDMAATKAFLSPLQAAGVKVTLDNFGTGYSNMYHMQELKFDKIKIDRRFTETLGRGNEARMLRALTGLGQGMGALVTAQATTGTQSYADLVMSGVQQIESSQSFLAPDTFDTFFADHNRLRAGI